MTLIIQMQGREEDPLDRMVQEMLESGREYPGLGTYNSICIPVLIIGGKAPLTYVFEVDGERAEYTASQIIETLTT